MTENDQPPLAPLSYVSPPARDENPYGRWDLRLFFWFAGVLAANSLLAAYVRMVIDPVLQNILAPRFCWIFCGAYVLLWVTGQVVFWYWPSEGPRPLSAFALACIGGLAVLGVVGNVVYLSNL